MKQFISIPALIMILCCSSFHVHAEIQDSIGVEKKDGKRYILHRMEAKETLYALSRKYGVSVDEIKKANVDVDINDIKIGQVLRVPKEDKTAPKDVVTTSPKIHVVLPGETLYSISRKYSVSVEDLKKENPSAASGLSIGDEIKIPGQAAVPTEPGKVTNNNVQQPAIGTATSHTVAAGETLYSISRKYNVNVEDLKKWNPEAAAGLKVGQVLKVLAPANGDQKNTDTPKIPVADPVKKDPVSTTNPPADTVLTREQEQEKKHLDSVANIRVVPSGEFKKVTETGFAEIIEGGDSEKYLALHKTAPVGTIIQVVNDANNQRIFVRVIGKLPANGLNDRVVLKISKKAFERLAGVDKKIPVTLSYIK